VFIDIVTELLIDLKQSHDARRMLLAAVYSHSCSSEYYQATNSAVFWYRTFSTNVDERLLPQAEGQRSFQIGKNAMESDTAQCNAAQGKARQQHVWCESFLPLSDQSSLQLVVTPSRQNDVEKDVRCYANAVPSHADRQQGASMKRQDLIVLYCTDPYKPQTNYSAPAAS